MGEVRVDLAQVARCGHGLVADHLGRQRDHVELRIAGQGGFRAATRAEQRDLEGLIVHRRRGIDEDLAHARHRRGSQRTAGGRIDRHVAPAGDDRAGLDELALQFARTGVVARRIEEDQAGRETWRQGDTRLRRQRAQPVVGPVDQHAAAVATDAVGVDAATVREPGQRGERGIDQRGAGVAVDLRDQPETAAVVFERLVVEARISLRHHRLLLASGCAG